MQIALLLAHTISAFAFLTYGLACFFSQTLFREFERYHLTAFRTLIGTLEVLGSVGLLIGFYFTPLRIVSALCLALLMLCALIVRFKIGDPFRTWIPALVLLLVNLIIAVGA